MLTTDQADIEKIAQTAQKNAICGVSFYFSRMLSMSALDTVRFSAFVTQLLEGGIVNTSEQRAAWHTEFRNPAPCAFVADSFKQIKTISDAIAHNQFPFEVRDIVNIGIGGSDLGPKLICEAFENELTKHVYFVSNLDRSQMQSVLKKISPQHTLFIVTSKSFRTLETLENMHMAKQWLIAHQQDPAQHIMAVTGNVAFANEVHQIPKSHILQIPEWLGGRYSIWSAVGLSCAIALGFDSFYELHQGAYEMDQHFYHTPVSENWVVQYALMMHQALSENQLKALIVLPYTYRLRSFPDYLQQLFMESLGKSVTTQDEVIHYPTGPMVFGGMGTNSQHSFQQLMMQGTHAIFADFILPLNQLNMIANCLTQVKTLREGVQVDDARKVILGGKTANLFAIDHLDRKSVGVLIAFYEHVVATLGFLLNINPFDQFGVEHAKCESEKLLSQYGDTIVTHIRDIIS